MPGFITKLVEPRWLVSLSNYSHFDRLSDRCADPGVFERADIDASFGSVRLDLCDVVLNEDVVVNVKAAFGGVGILVPKDVNVDARSHSFFGGVNNRADDLSRRQPCNHTILINADCSFAGVEIR